MYKNVYKLYDCKRSVPASHFSCKIGEAVRTKKKKKKKKCLREGPIYNRIKHHFTTCGLCNLLTCSLNYMFNPFFYLSLEFCDFCVGELLLFKLTRKNQTNDSTNYCWKVTTNGQIRSHLTHFQQEQETSSLTTYILKIKKKNLNFVF